MPMTKVTTMQWTDPFDAATHESFQQLKAAYLQNAIASGATDGIVTQGAALEWSRSWKDQASADAWAAFITDLATKLGNTVTVDITDK